MPENAFACIREHQYKRFLHLLTTKYVQSQCPKDFSLDKEVSKALKLFFWSKCRQLLDQNVSACDELAWFNHSVKFKSTCTHDAEVYSVCLVFTCVFAQGSRQCVSRWSAWRPPGILSGPPTPALWASRSLVRLGSSSSHALCMF